MIAKSAVMGALTACTVLLSSAVKCEEVQVAQIPDRDCHAEPRKDPACASSVRLFAPDVHRASRRPGPFGICLPLRIRPYSTGLVDKFVELFRLGLVRNEKQIGSGES